MSVTLLQRDKDQYLRQKVKGDIKVNENFKRKVARIDKAIDHQIKIYRKFPPKLNDFIVEYEMTICWHHIICLYSLIEQALKCLFEIRGIQHRHGHELKKALFDRLPDKDKKTLRIAYKVYQSLHFAPSLYSGDLPPQSVDDFLEKMGNGYVNWRYFLLEDKRSEISRTHVGAMLEVARTLAYILVSETFTDHGLDHVGHRLHWRIVRYLYRPSFDKFWCPDPDKWTEDDLTSEDLHLWKEKYNGNAMNFLVDLIHSEGLIGALPVKPVLKDVFRKMLWQAQKYDEKNRDNYESNRGNYDEDFALFYHRASQKNYLLTWENEKGFVEKFFKKIDIKKRWV